MQVILVVIHLFLALGIIGLVLIQHGKGADAGAAFGSGASATVFGARGSTSFLSHSTAVLAALFFSTSLALAYYASLGATTQGIMQRLQAAKDKAQKANVTTIPEKADVPAAVPSATSATLTKKDVITVTPSKSSPVPVATISKVEAVKPVVPPPAAPLIEPVAPPVVKPITPVVTAPKVETVKPVVPPPAAPLIEPVAPPVIKPITPVVTAPKIETVKPVVPPPAAPLIEPVAPPVIKPVTPVVAPKVEVVKPVVPTLAAPLTEPVAPPVIKPVTSVVTAPKVEVVKPVAPIELVAPVVVAPKIEIEAVKSVVEQPPSTVESH